MCELQEVEIDWYGERGIVNALVTALRREGKQAVQSLLETIVWADGTQPEWIQQITSVRIIVEVSLGQFGDPDLILVCKTTSDKTYSVFIETKTGSYQNCAASNNEGMSRPGFNSSINGQLSLKYRFATALANWQCGEQRLVEPKALFDLYKRIPAEGGLRDPMKTPRYLQKPEVLEILGNANLARISPDNCFFVAWTKDSEPFFSNEGVETDLLPLFLSEGQDEIKPHVGWLGYKKIQEAEELYNLLGQSYQEAVATMISEPTGDEETPIDTENLPKVKSINIERYFSSQTIQTLNELQDLAAEYFDRRTIDRKQGSISITPFKKVLLKLVPQKQDNEEFIILGISTRLNLSQCNGRDLKDVRLIGKGRNPQPFYIVDLRKTPDPLSFSEDVFAEIKAHLGLKTEKELT